MISGLTAPLAKAGIGVFVLSTYDTDYILVKGTNFWRASALLRQVCQVVDQPGLHQAHMCPVGPSGRPKRTGRADFAAEMLTSRRRSPIPTRTRTGTPRQT